VHGKGAAAYSVGVSLPDEQNAMRRSSLTRANIVKNVNLKVAERRVARMAGNGHMQVLRVNATWISGR